MIRVNRCDFHMNGSFTDFEDAWFASKGKLSHSCAAILP